MSFYEVRLIYADYFNMMDDLKCNLLVVTSSNVCKGDLSLVVKESSLLI